MIKVGLQVMSTVLLLLVCGSCATGSGIRYGSNIELEAGSDRGKGNKAKVGGAGLFFSGKLGRIELGRSRVFCAIVGWVIAYQLLYHPGSSATEASMLAGIGAFIG